MKTYIQIGAGGTGSHLIGPALAFLDSWHTNNGEDWEYYVVDGDNFAASNRIRQLFEPKYIGTNKAIAMADTYRQYPIFAEPRYVGKEDLEKLIPEDSVVFLCVDNFSLRALIQEHVQSLKNAVVINGGNEYHDGSVQIWVRQKGKNKTPPLTYLHPEIAYQSADDRAGMTCAQAMELPGGEQLIIANMAVAQHMMTALWRYHSGEWANGWTELNFDLKKSEVFHMNRRENKNWEKDRIPEGIIHAAS